jgi:acyl-CoA synthetase (AMP-forming)/AMP-acid ligase II
MSNLSRLVRHHALRAPEKVALAQDGQQITYAELWRRICAVAGLLRRRGVIQGDRVALFMKNSAAFVEIAFAASHVGAVLVPVNFRLAPDEVDYILEDSAAVLLFRDEELASWTPAVPAAIHLSPDAQRDASSLGNGDGNAMAPVGENDLLRIMYTSGTTDRPKGVMHTYRNFYAKSSDQIIDLGLTSNTRLLVCGPLYHVGAFDLPGVAVLWAGGMLCIQRDYNPGRALDLIERERLTGAWLAPVMAGELLASQEAQPRDVSSLEWIIGGGERTPESRIRQFCAAFPNARYIDAYGLTETCGGDTLMERGRELEKSGSVGRALSQVDIEIRDDEGRPVPPGSEGEICIRGAKVTQGYWHAPEKTAASFFGDWLRTGDVGYLDTQGFLFITDRKKDMIISGGENIASSEVERAIFELPQVRDAAVVGAPDTRWGERPVTFVVLHPGLTLMEAEILSHCRNRLAAFKVPDRVIFVSGLPRSASGKVLKRELRESLAVPRSLSD